MTTPTIADVRARVRLLLSGPLDNPDAERWRAAHEAVTRAPVPMSERITLAMAAGAALVLRDAQGEEGQ